MSETNGRNKWIMYLTSVIMGIFMLILPAMANYIVKNDKESRERDKAVEAIVNKQTMEVVQRLSRMEMLLEILVKKVKVEGE